VLALLSPAFNNFPARRRRHSGSETVFALSFSKTFSGKMFFHFILALSVLL